MLYTLYFIYNMIMCIYIYTIYIKSYIYGININYINLKNCMLYSKDSFKLKKRDEDNLTIKEWKNLYLANIIWKNNEIEAGVTILILEKLVFNVIV